jgi:hypothetical protein
MSADQLLRATVVVSVVLVVLVGATLVVTIQSRANLDATIRSDEVSACRAAFNAELITGPTAAALKAIADHGIDSREYQAAADSVDVDRYLALTELSRTAPARFVATCKREAPD